MLNQARVCLPKHPNAGSTGKDNQVEELKQAIDTLGKAIALMRKDDTNLNVAVPTHPTCDNKLIPSATSDTGCKSTLKKLSLRLHPSNLIQLVLAKGLSQSLPTMG